MSIPMNTRMRREAAALFLGVSTKTLYRLEQAGKLPSRKEKNVKGHVTEYDLADLERLKKQKEALPPVPKNPLPSALKRVTFGLPSEDFDELAKGAQKCGLKPGEYARLLMRESLEGKLMAEIRDLRAQEKKNADSVKLLRSEMAAAVESLLLFLNLSPEEARTWVTDNLR